MSAFPFSFTISNSAHLLSRFTRPALSPPGVGSHPTRRRHRHGLSLFHRFLALSPRPVARLSPLTHTLTHTHSHTHIRRPPPQELSDRPLTDRWQSLIHVYMTSQVHALLHFGYTPDDQGLRSFVVEYDALSKDKLSDEGKNLFELTRKRWNAMVKRAFNVDLDVQELPVEQARQLSSILSMKMQSDDFMAQIDSSMVRRVGKVGEMGVGGGRRGWEKRKCLWASMRHIVQSLACFVSHPSSAPQPLTPTPTTAGKARQGCRRAGKTADACGDSPAAAAAGGGGQRLQGRGGLHPHADAADAPLDGRRRQLQHNVRHHGRLPPREH